MKMPEAPVLLIGNVFRVNPVTKYGTTDPDGAKVAVMAGDGATEVKLTPAQLSALAPVPGDQIAWHVRFGHYAMENTSGLSVQLVTPADVGSVQAVHEVVNGPSERAGK